MMRVRPRSTRPGDVCASPSWSQIATLTPCCTSRLTYDCTACTGTPHIGMGFGSSLLRAVSVRSRSGATRSASSENISKKSPSRKKRTASPTSRLTLRYWASIGVSLTGDFPPPPCDDAAAVTPFIPSACALLRAGFPPLAPSASPVYGRRVVPPGALRRRGPDRRRSGSHALHAAATIRNLEPRALRARPGEAGGGGGPWRGFARLGGGERSPRRDGPRRRRHTRFRFRPR